MGKENKQIEKGGLKMENGKDEKGRMDMPLVPPPSLQENEEPKKTKAGKTKPRKKNLRKKAVKKNPKKNRPRKFDFSMNGNVSAKMCPICRLCQTQQVNTKGNIQYRECLNGSCPGNPRDNNKKTYKVVGQEI